jgi:thioester reductase-like protein
MWQTPDTGLLITGFPGFIAGRLVERLIPERPDAFFYLLAEARFEADAKAMCQEIERKQPAFAKRWRVLKGDIRKPRLGISGRTLGKLKKQMSEVWHLAAIYDLAVPQSLAYAVNVDGTENVLDVCDTFENLRRLQYISTCYVSGTRTGRVFELDLDCGQDFKNHYEATKHWAEAKVQRRRDRIPTTVFRPSIVIGDSKTGETVKGDGPYMVVNLLSRLPRWLPMVHLGESAAQVNLVPVDYLVEAMVRLSALDGAKGRVYQLADPAPKTAREILEMCIKTMRRAPALTTVPVEIAYLLNAVPQARDFLQLPNQTLDYFNHYVEYDVSNTTEDLGSGLRCPRLEDYWSIIVSYALANPQIFATH